MTVGPQLWPPVDQPSLLITSSIRDAAGVESIPGMAKALQVYSGLMEQMPLVVQGDGHISRDSTFLAQPDPLLSRANFVSSSVRDYWLHGNTASLVLTRDENGLPLAVKYFPAHMWQIPAHEPDVYYLAGKPVPAREVVHVQRGVDPFNPRRGQGAVEQHLETLRRIDLQEKYEADSLGKAGVPSVAVIAPQRDLSDKQIQKAADTWMEKFEGPTRRPAILPNGTDIKTLSWNPTDQQLVMARQLSLTDIANIMNLDGYYVGAPGSSHTYKSAGSMFVALLRMSLAPVMSKFEETWGRAFIPHGQELKFDRLELTRDDFQTEVATGVQAVNAGLITVDEWRERQGMTAYGLDESQRPRLEANNANLVDARAVAEMIQKIYLGVGKVVSADEAREILRKAGADISGSLPDSVDRFEQSIGLTEEPEEPEEDPESEEENDDEN